MGKRSSSVGGGDVDFHKLPRRKLQQLCKKHGIPANKTNSFMADALAEVFKDSALYRDASASEGNQIEISSTTNSCIPEGGNVELEDVTVNSEELESMISCPENTVQGSQVVIQSTQEAGSLELHEKTTKIEHAIQGTVAVQAASSQGSDNTDMVEEASRGEYTVKVEDALQGCEDVVQVQEASALIKNIDNVGQASQGEGYTVQVENASQEDEITAKTVTVVNGKADDCILKNVNLNEDKMAAVGEESQSNAERGLEAELADQGIVQAELEIKDRDQTPAQENEVTSKRADESPETDKTEEEACEVAEKLDAKINRMSFVTDSIKENVSSSGVMQMDSCDHSNEPQAEGDRPADIQLENTGLEAKQNSNKNDCEMHNDLGCFTDEISASKETENEKEDGLSGKISEKTTPEEMREFGTHDLELNQSLNITDDELLNMDGPEDMELEVQGNKNQERKGISVDTRNWKEMVERAIRKARHKSSYKQVPFFKRTVLNRSLAKARQNRTQVLIQRRIEVHVDNVHPGNGHVPQPAGHDKTLATGPKRDHAPQPCFGRKRFMEKVMAESAKKLSEKKAFVEVSPLRNISNQIRVDPSLESARTPRSTCKVGASDDEIRRVPQNFCGVGGSNTFENEIARTPRSICGGKVAEVHKKHQERFKTPLSGRSHQKSMVNSRRMESMQRNILLSVRRGMFHENLDSPLKTGANVLL